MSKLQLYTEIKIAYISHDLYDETILRDGEYSITEDKETSFLNVYKHSPVGGRNLVRMFNLTTILFVEFTPKT